ncbi:MAG: hypothetical protein WBF99_06460 [Xanthobacteraceae bacterium]
MGQIKTLADAAYSDFVTQGVPASGVKPPRKPEIRALFTAIDAQFGSLANYDADLAEIRADIEDLQTATSTGIEPFDTKANMLSAGVADGAGAWVFDDPTETNNGVWKNNGGSYVQLLAISLPGIQRQLVRVESNTTLALALTTSELQQQVPVFSSGIAAMAREAEVLSGEAFPFVWSGRAFNCGTFGYVVTPESFGNRLRVRIYQSDAATVLATGYTAPIYSREGVAAFYLDAIVSTSPIAETTIYIAIDFPAGVGLFAGHTVVGYNDRNNYSSYPAKFTSKANPKENLSDWAEQTPSNTPRPMAIRLYDSRSLGGDPLADVRLAPDMPVVTPRHFMLINEPWNIYPNNLRCGREARNWSISAIDLAGVKALKDRATYESSVAFDDVPVTVEFRDPKSNGIVGTGFTRSLASIRPTTKARRSRCWRSETA